MAEFRRGEVVKVSNRPDRLFEYWEERIFVTKIEGTFYPYVCVADGYEDAFQKGALFTTMGWKCCRKKRPDLKVDDPLVVWNEQEGRSNAHLRYFAKWSEDGCPLCWRNGCTSWTVCYPTHYSKWDHYEIPDNLGVRKNENNNRID